MHDCTHFDEPWRHQRRRRAYLGVHAFQARYILRRDNLRWQISTDLVHELPVSTMLRFTAGDLVSLITFIGLLFGCSDGTNEEPINDVVVDVADQDSGGQHSPDQPADLDAIGDSDEHIEPRCVAVDRLDIIDGCRPRPDWVPPS